jgi:hypothetical protein
VPEADHLRAALAEVDHLRNVLLVERGEGVPPSSEWDWCDCGGWGMAWVYRYDTPNHWVAVCRKLAMGWYVRVGAEQRAVGHACGVSLQTAFEAMEAANAALKATQ